jgi:serine/threonine protein kinase
MSSSSGANLKQFADLEDQYEIIKQLGEGAYGVVVAAKEKKGGVKVAVKKIKDAVEDKEQGKLLLRELKLLRHFRGHENVVGIKDIIESPSGQSRFKDIYIVTDLMDTDLNRIIRSTQELSDDHVRYFTYQVRCPLRPKILDSDRRSAEHDGVRARPQPL